MIQMLTYSGKEDKLEGSEIVINSLHDPQSLDEFDINIINLADGEMWANCSDSKSRVNNSEDLGSLSTMIMNSHKTKVVILIPQNKTYMYDFYEYQGYVKSCELKNMLNQMVDYILPKLYVGFKRISLCYENTITKIENKNISAAFYFEDADDALLVSAKSNKPTTINCGDVILSTLELKEYEHVIGFLKEINLLCQKQAAPDWMKGMFMFDDEQQAMTIEKNKQVIKAAENNIANAMEKIDKNNEYKSILYTTGEELVKVVFEILECMLGCDLSQFEDKKKEDFSFERNGIVYIGEIKGISSNIKSQNISQLEFHHQGFIDEHPEIEDKNLRQILIINYQRNTALQERDPVDKKQIELASKYGSLIVETRILLKMFEKYKKEELTREECFALLEQNGILEIN